MGLDVAGVVESVGAAVTRFRPGDRVFADLFSYGAGHSPSTRARPEKAFLPIPAGLSFETRPPCRIRRSSRSRGFAAQGPNAGPGDKVLIDGASGNVGPFAVQIAKALRRRGDRRRQHGQAGLRALARRRPRHRLHGGRLHEDRRALRLDPRHRLAPLDPPRSGTRCGRTACTSRSAGRRGRSSRRWSSGRSSRWAAASWTGLMLWWKPFNPPDVDDPDRADRGRHAQAGHRPALPAERGRRGAALRRRRARPRQGRDHRWPRARRPEH